MQSYIIEIGSKLINELPREIQILDNPREFG